MDRNLEYLEHFQRFFILIVRSERGGAKSLLTEYFWQRATTKY